jgi:hypothetical protein
MNPRMSVIDANLQQRWIPTPQGQMISPIITRDDAPWTELSAMNIVMTPGRVSVPHDHDGVVTPLIYLVRATGRGVATFLGDELEELVWLRPGEWGSIAHTPHMAVYPRLTPDMVDAEGIEIRNASHVSLHTTPRPDLWPIARQRIEEQGWNGKVTWPQEALEAFHRADHPVPAADAVSCFPSLPLATPQSPDIMRRPYGD